MGPCLQADPQNHIAKRFLRSVHITEGQAVLARAIAPRNGLYGQKRPRWTVLFTLHNALVSGSADAMSRRLLGGDRMAALES